MMDRIFVQTKILSPGPYIISGIGAGAGAPPMPGVYIAAAATTVTSVKHTDSRSKGLAGNGLSKQAANCNNTCYSIPPVHKTSLDNAVAGVYQEDCGHCK